MRWRSIRTRLTLLVFATGLAAIAVVFFYVTPQLESSLREQKLESLAAAADDYAPRLRDTTISEKELNARVRSIADQANARVTLLGVSDGSEGLRTYVVSDSTEEVEIRDLEFAVADDAARTRRTQRATESAAEGRQAQAAKPLFTGRRVTRVVVLSAPLADVAANVALIRRQILIAGALALALSLVAGMLVARALSRRIKALEQGAERVAAGDFSARFPTSQHDELGQLARALDDMQRQLAQLDSARKRFIATASHELRTPIFSLGGFLELLEDEDLDEATRAQFVAQVRQQVARLGKLATDLLDLNRLETGALELHREPTDVAVLARAVASEFQPALTAHGSQIVLRLAGRRIDAVCDPERVAQVLRILIDNALIHTPPGTDMELSADRRNGRVRMAVRDFGPGIRREAMPRVFEPFFTSDDVQGSGLGLAIASELADRMEGRLDVESAPGRTTFALDLPA